MDRRRYQDVAEESRRIKDRHPMVELFDYDGTRTLAYDAKSHFAALFGPSELQSLKRFLSGEGPVDLAGERLSALRRAGVFAEGPLESVSETDPEAVRRMVRGFEENVVPRRFTLEVTQDCNLRCRYCPYTLAEVHRRHARNTMTLEVARKAIDLYFARYVRMFEKAAPDLRPELLHRAPPTLYWYGGETLLNFKVVKESHAYFLSRPWSRHGVPADAIRTSINTNLTVLTDEMIDFLAGNAVLTQVSLDGPKEEHDRNRVFEDGRGSFDAVFANLQRLRTRAPEHFKTRVLLLSVEAENTDRRRCREFLSREDLAVASQIAFPAERAGEFVDPGEAPAGEPEALFEELRRYAERLAEVQPGTFDDYIAQDPDRVRALKAYRTIATDKPVGRERWRMSLTCPMGFDHMMVSYDGRIHMCSKTDGSVPVGHVDRGLDTEDIAAHYERLGKRSAERGCRSCWCFQFCRLCAAKKAHGGDFRMPSAEDCAALRRNARRSFYMHIAMSRRPGLLRAVRERVDDDPRRDGVVDLRNLSRSGPEPADIP